MIKTAIENKQNLIVEGCYIPFDWQKDFDKNYLSQIHYICLILSKDYISTHFSQIQAWANVIENRENHDSSLSMDSLMKENLENLEHCKQMNLDYLLIHDTYDVDLEHLKLRNWRI